MMTHMILRAALRSLRRAPARSGLTALGVIVGVAAVVATASIGGGAKAAIQETLSKPESRTIFLGATAPRSEARKLFAKLSPADSLKPEDYFAIRNAVGSISATSPRIYLANANVRAKGHSLQAVLEGIDVEGFVTVPRQLLKGELFSQADVSHAANVAVVSEALVTSLFLGEVRRDLSIRINDTSFTVIGVVDDVQNNGPAMFHALDLHVYVPFTSLLRRLDPTAAISVSVQPHDIEHISLIQQRIGDLMEQRRSSRKASFLISNAFDSIKTYADGSLILARLLAAVGAIALIVGGIGIMNIMLVSVSERTREIGIRMAVGTRGRDILSQFLTEAIALSLLGGSVGIAVGWAASWFITRLNGWPTTLTTASIVTALMCSVAVGIFFGYHPARRAALLEPVEALRTEG